MSAFLDELVYSDRARITLGLSHVPALFGAQVATGAHASIARLPALVLDVLWVVRMTPERAEVRAGGEREIAGQNTAAIDSQIEITRSRGLHVIGDMPPAGQCQRVAERVAPLYSGHHFRPGRASLGITQNCVEISDNK